MFNLEWFLIRVVWFSKRRLVGFWKVKYVVLLFFRGFVFECCLKFLSYYGFFIKKVWWGLNEREVIVFDLVKAKLIWFVIIW